MQVPMVSFKERAEDGKTLASRLRDEILESRLLFGSFQSRRNAERPIQGWP